MALIGTIAINMKVTTAALAKGLGSASKLVSGFAGQVRMAGNQMSGVFAGLAAGAAGANEPAKKTAENTKKTVDVLSRMEGHLASLVRQGLGNIGDLFTGNF